MLQFAMREDRGVDDDPSTYGDREAEAGESMRPLRVVRHGDSGSSTSQRAKAMVVGSRNMLRMGRFDEALLAINGALRMPNLSHDLLDDAREIAHEVIRKLKEAKLL